MSDSSDLPGSIESWNRQFRLRDRVLQVRCEVHLVASGLGADFEVRVYYEQALLTVTRHLSQAPALYQSERLKHFLDERGWELPKVDAHRQAG